VTWRFRDGPDEELADALTGHLVDHNTAASEAVRLRFEPGNLASRPVAAFALDDDGELLGGCVGRTEDVWAWLTVDTMWVAEAARGTGLGAALLARVEDEARSRGCTRAKVNTWDFQAPGFHEAQGYAVYAREEDYPPGHTNVWLRKDL
jgi:GNAT superfamily N-acetyltransferase